MKARRSEVKSKIEKGGKRELVGIADYNEYENLQEAITDLTEAEVLKLVNTQAKTNALNAVRASATQKPTKQALLMKAVQTMDPAELASLQGDPQKLTARLEQLAKDLEGKYEEDRRAQQREMAAKAKSEAVDEDDEDDNGDDA
jgi:hypothetical protein